MSIADLLARHVRFISIVRPVERPAEERLGLAVEGVLEEALRHQPALLGNYRGRIRR